MSIVVKIESTETTPTRYTSKRTGRPDQEQVGWAFLSNREGVQDRYPTRIVFVVDQPYPVGDYTLSPSAFYVGDYGKLACSVRLAPLPKKSTASA